MIMKREIAVLQVLTKIRQMTLNDLKFVPKNKIYLNLLKKNFGSCGHVIVVAA